MASNLHIYIITGFPLKFSLPDCHLDSPIAGEVATNRTEIEMKWSS